MGYLECPVHTDTETAQKMQCKTHCIVSVLGFQISHRPFDFLSCTTAFVPCMSAL